MMKFRFVNSRQLWINAQLSIVTNLNFAIHHNTQLVLIFSRSKIFHLKRLENVTWFYSFAIDKFLKNFIGVSINKCYCINDITGSNLLSNRACNSKCPGDSDELCGGKGTLSIHQLKNDSFTDNLAILTGKLVWPQMI